MRTKIMSGFIADIWSGFTVPNAPCKIKVKLQFKFTQVNTVSNEDISFILVKLQKKIMNLDYNIHAAYGITIYHRNRLTLYTVESF